MRKYSWIAVIATAIAVVGVGQSSSSAPLPGDDPGQTVDRFQAAYRAGSVKGMLDLYDTDAVFEDVNQRHRFEGTEQLQALLSGIVAMHLSLDLEEERRVVAGDTVVVEYAYRGTLNGAALGASVGKEGCPNLAYVLPVTSWFRIENGLIAHQKDFIDWATFLDLRNELLASGTDTSGDTGS